MKETEIQGLVDRARQLGTDDGFVEIKEAGGGLPKGVWESLSAFANTGGGTIILGLSEANDFEPVPGFDAGRVLDQFESGLDESSNGAKITPVPRVDLGMDLIDGKRVVVAKIHPLDAQLDRGPGPVYVVSKGLENGSYKRLADKDKRLSTYEIYAIKTQWQRPDVDTAPVPNATLKDLDENLLRRLFEKLEREKSRALVGTETQEERLRRLNIVNVDGQVTLAGLLVFGVYPQQFYPQLVIDVAVHATTEKASSGKLRFIDRQVCDGPLPLAINDAVSAVIRNLRTHRFVEGVSGTDVSEIPEEVLREAITNAVMHRDYSQLVQGQQVAVEVFSDRVEISNPGGLWGGVTLDTLYEGRSNSRNQHLGNLLRITPSHGSVGSVAENQGTGLLVMRDYMRKQGLPLPDFAASITGVKVTLARHGVLDPEVNEWLAALPGRDKRNRMAELILAVTRKHDRVTVNALRKKLGIDSDEIRYLLGDLLEEGLISGAGDGPYVLVDSNYEYTPLDLEVLSVLDHSKEMSTREIAEYLGRSVTSLRPVLRRLVDVGAVTATAPVTSRNRRYLLGVGVNTGEG